MPKCGLGLPRPGDPDRVRCGRDHGHRGDHEGSFEPQRGYLTVVRWHTMDLRPETMEAYAAEWGDEPA